MPNTTTHEPTPALCACGCGTPLPAPRFPSRQRRYIVGHGLRSRVYTRRSLASRFWHKVENRGPDDCWEWQAYRDRDGYGHIRMDDLAHTDAGAHRVSYELAFGHIPDGMMVCHRCDNPRCVNPEHLFLGTNTDNMRDRSAKGRKAGPAGIKQHNSKLTEEQVKAIRERYAAGGVTMYQLAAEYGVGAGPICNIIHRKSWKHVHP